MSRPSQEQYRRRCVQPIESHPLNSRSHSVGGMNRPNAAGQRLNRLYLDGADDSRDIGMDPQRLEFENMPLAPRQPITLRSRSEIKPSRKQEFRMRMDDRMQKMRQQGQQVDGLVKLHALFNRMKYRKEVRARNAAFFLLYDICEDVRRQAHKDNIRRTFQERQVFAKTSKPPRSGNFSQPSKMASAADISYNSSNEVSGRGPLLIANITGSSSSLQFGSQIFKDDSRMKNQVSYSGEPVTGETPSSKQGTYQMQQQILQEVPPMEYNLPPTNNYDYPHLQKLRERRAMMRHQRSESENTLEAPRIMMNMSPSMHNISGPDLMKSQSNSMQQINQGYEPMVMRKRSIPPRPQQRWLP